ncbi:MAG: c-type cytochrome [Gammaproteobacteria bacterium]|nr:c-type cytochrome [Gammaproteobacteria bacterium]
MLCQIRKFAVSYSWLLLLAIMPTAAVAFDYLQVLPTEPLVPKHNPLSNSKIQLGKQLFFDKRLSINQAISCNDCHNIYLGGDNDQPRATGVSGVKSKRNAPTLLNIGFQTVYHWDGRFKSLEQQTIAHIQDADIMGISKSSLLIERLEQDKKYQSGFENAFGSETPITLTNIAKALSSFERALTTPNSPFDQYLQGNKNTLSHAAIRGMKLFNDTGCLACHFGTNFAGPAPGPAMGLGDGFYELFPNYIGSSYDTSHQLVDDLGRYEFTKQQDEKYMWRVPPLRNIALTAPYFHNGSAKTLKQAIIIMAKTQTNVTLSEQEVTDIEAFLNSLTGELPAILQPTQRAIKHAQKHYKPNP